MTGKIKSIQIPIGARALAIRNGQELNTVRLLGHDEYEGFVMASRQLSDFEKSQKLFAMLRLNYETYKSHVTTTQKKISGSAADLIEMQDYYLDMNRHLLNTLGMFRSYIDHNEANISRMFGKSSLQLQEYRAILKNAYDSQFAYRFLYKLRNYTQHCGMPIGRFSTDSRLIKSEIGAEVGVHRLDLEFSRNELLANYDSWGAVKAELESMAEFFQISPIVVALMGCLERLSNSVEKLYLRSLKSPAKQVRQLYDSANNKDGVVVIVESKVTQATPPRRINMKMWYFRMDLVELVENTI